MKTIRNGKVYDTETAALIHVDTNDGKIVRRQILQESLYRKRTGEFFIFTEHRDGGVADGGVTGRCSITPITYEEAMGWAETYAPADTWVEVFGNPEDGTSMISAKVSNKAKTALERKASSEGVSQTEIIERLILENLL